MLLAATGCTLTFEQGTNGYMGVSDTYVDAGSPDSTKDQDSLVRIRLRKALFALAEHYRGAPSQ